MAGRRLLQGSVAPRPVVPGRHWGIAAGSPTARGMVLTETLERRLCADFVRIPPVKPASAVKGATNMANPIDRR